MPGSVSKAQIRHRIWDLLTRRGIALFPGAFGRTPTFHGQSEAVRRLRDLAPWRNAQRVLSLDEPVLAGVRAAAVEDGKVLVLADLSRCAGGWILEIDPQALGPERARDAARASGCGLGAPLEGVRALRGRETAPVDLMVIGAVAVDRHGARIGKGAGAADLVYALGRDRGILRAETPVIVLVHRLQLFDEPVDREPTDLPVDIVVTPEEAIAIDTVVMRPKGLHPSMITAQRLEAYPGLRDILEREGISIPGRGWGG